MQPDFQQPNYQPQQPQPVPTQEQPQPQQPKKRNGRTVAALWLLIGPTALLIVSFILFAIINWVTAATVTPTPTPAEGGSLFGESSAGSTIANIILFLAAGISALTFLPGIIIGIILLATRPRAS